MLNGVVECACAVTKTLIVLERAPFPVYLTGSRFFGTEVPSSDWDFFTADSPATRAYLQKEGFTEPRTKQYASPDVVTVFRKVGRGTPGFDVQIVKDVTVKSAVQQMLKTTGMLTARTSKAKAREIWTLAFSMWAIMANKVPADGDMVAIPIGADGNNIYCGLKRF